jgi:short subunit dehydrogenase-like uncharacterized protein
LVVKHLMKHAPKNLKWAIAGRRAAALEEIIDGKQIGKILCEADSEEQNEQLAKRTQVVLALAGPFNKYGRNLVKACAENGTDYADITGEIALFV